MTVDKISQLTEFHYYCACVGMKVQQLTVKQTYMDLINWYIFIPLKLFVVVIRHLI